MRLVHAWFFRIRALLGLAGTASDLASEMQFHIEKEIEKNIRAGMPPGEAKRRAHIRFGGVDRMRERSRDARGGRWIEETVRDLEYAIRVLRRSPGYALTAILTLCLGIGATTAIFSVVNGALLRPLPFPDSDRIVELLDVTESGGTLPTSYVNFIDWKAEAESFQAMAGYTGVFPTAAVGGVEPVTARARFVTADFFEVFGSNPHRGRWLGAEDHAPGAEQVAVASYDFWRTTLDATDDLESVRIGTSSEDEAPIRIVGVMPEDFHSPADADLWLSLDRQPFWNTRGNHVLYGLGRIDPDGTLERSDAELDAIMARIRSEFGSETDVVSVQVTPIRDRILGSSRGTIWMLMGASALLMLLACANLASLFLARGLNRKGEIAVRSALGAGRSRLIRTLVTQAVVLGAIGGVVGILFGIGLLRSILSLGAQFLPTTAEVAVDARVVLVATGVALASALLFSVIPAWKLTVRGGGSQAGALRSGGSALRRGGWSVLMASEIALAFTLLAGSGLMARSVWNIVTADVGYDASDVVRAQISIPSASYPSDGETIQLLESMTTALRAETGFTTVGVANLLPIQNGQLASRVTLEDGTQPEVSADYRIVDDAFFEVLDIALLEGRGFGAAEGYDDPHSAVVSASLAERIWPGESAVGKRFSISGMDPYRENWLTVVGVAADARHWSSAPGSQLTYYLPVSQRPAFARFFAISVLVESDLPTDRVTQTIRTTLAGIDGDIPPSFREVDALVASTTADRRLSFILLLAFGATGLALVSIGIFGVVSYAVMQRRREAGIRLALGATPASVRSLFMRGSGGFVLAGVGVGILSSALASRFLSSLLFSVSPLDPMVFLGISVLVLTVGLIAAYLPARRATRIDPVASMRPE